MGVPALTEVQGDMKLGDGVGPCRPCSHLNWIPGVQSKPVQ